MIVSSNVNPSTHPVSEDEFVDVVQAITAALRRRWRVIVIAMVCGAVAITIPALISRLRWTSSGSFLTQSHQPSGVGGLAAEFGIAIPLATGAESPAFYADLVTSREVLERIADGQFTLLMDGQRRQGTLPVIFALTQHSPERRREDAIRRLRESIKTTQDHETGVVTVDVTTISPILSQMIAERLLDVVNAFNLEIRHSSATAERRFAEARLAEASAGLHAAEEDFQNFLQNNRVTLAPALQLESDRLRRTINMRQDVMTTLAQSAEQARLEEVRDIPMINVIEHPEVPILPDSRHIVSKILLGLLGGAMVGMSLVLWLEYRHRPI